MKHEMQHADDGPTWCIHCGTFSTWCRSDDECDAKEPRRFDARNPVTNTRMMQDLIGTQEAQR